MFCHQLPRHFLRGTVGVESPVGQHHHLVYGGVQLLQPVLGQDDRHAKLLVDASEHLEERPGRHRVQLSGGLVQHQHVRLHDHDASQVHLLFLTAGEGVDVPVEQLLQAEELGHLRHPQADSLLIQPQIFQPEGQLMPHLVGDQLAVRVLHHVADSGALVPEGQPVHRRAVERHLTGAGAVGGNGWFQLL